MKAPGADQSGRLLSTMVDVVLTVMAEPGRLGAGVSPRAPGAVGDLDVKPGIVSASVQGSRYEPYMATARRDPHADAGGWAARIDRPLTARSALHVHVPGRRLAVQARCRVDGRLLRTARLRHRAVPSVAHRAAMQSRRRPTVRRRRPNETPTTRTTSSTPMLRLGSAPTSAPISIRLRRCPSSRRLLHRTARGTTCGPR